MRKIKSAISKIVVALTICLVPAFIQSKPITRGIILYTPYTSRSVTPGKALNYSIQIINETDDIQNVRFSLSGIPGSWEPVLSAGSNTIQQIAVKPKALASNNSESIDLDLTIPLKIKKGTYHFKLIARTDSGIDYSLPLRVEVTEQGTFQTSLQIDQANMEGYADSDFNYNMTLTNRTAQEQNYALTADAPPGWNVRFRSGGDYVTSVTIASNQNKKIYIKVNSPEKVKADTYKIKVRATSGTTSDTKTLETVIKGKYNLKLTTSTGRLSTEVTAGSQKDVELLLENTGSIPLNDIKLTASPPADWDVNFNSQQINQLNPGESTTVQATIKASDKAIAGDYELDINADTPDASSKATFRVTVDKSVLWGSMGIFIILLVIGGISYLIRKYGRR